MPNSMTPVRLGSKVSVVSGREVVHTSGAAWMTFHRPTRRSDVDGVGDGDVGVQALGAEDVVAGLPTLPCPSTVFKKCRRGRGSAMTKKLGSSSSISARWPSSRVNVTLL